MPDDEDTNKPVRVDESAEEWPGPRATVVHFQGMGALPGCLIGIVTFVVFMAAAAVLLVVGGVAALFGGRRLAAACMRRAKFPDTRPFSFNRHDDPDVIDITPEPGPSRKKT